VRSDPSASELALPRGGLGREVDETSIDPRRDLLIFDYLFEPDRPKERRNTMKHLNRTAKMIRVSALALTLLMMAAAAPVHANPISKWLGGKATKAVYEKTGHVCTDKPWYIPIPSYLWYNLTCAKVAR
jgi:hypothetical protein